MVQDERDDERQWQSLGRGFRIGGMALEDTEDVSEVGGAAGACQVGLRACERLVDEATGAQREASRSR